LLLLLLLLLLHLRLLLLLLTMSCIWRPSKVQIRQLLQHLLCRSR
jgi:hypothetical protein